MFQNSFSKPRFRPAINVGCLMDVSTGKYELGKHGESILNGGISCLTGIAARPNNFKTALAIYMLTQLRRVCHNAHVITYDTEGTLPTNRFESAMAHDPYLSQIDLDNDEQFAFTDLSVYTGDQWFDVFRKTVTEKPKNEKAYLRTTPFLDNEGKARSALYPTGAMIDSFSKFTVSAVEEIYNKNKIGDGGANTDAMTNGKAKNQMFNQMPTLTARTGTYMILTAHVGDIINMEMYPTDKRNLSYMKKDTVLKGVSGGFYSLPNNVWMVTANKPLQNKDKMPEYPLDNATAMQGDTNLVLLTMINLRGKNGISGVPINVIATQSEGILAGLTEFHYCKENNRFGIGGNVQNYYLELLPDVSLSRTKVRKKLQEEPILQRAMQLTAEILQIQQFQRDVDPKYICDMKTLYEDLIAKGYDWRVLLNTRGYWTFAEEEKEHELPYLSAMDLLRMRTGEYVPYWLPKDVKQSLKLTATASPSKEGEAA